MGFGCGELDLTGFEQSVGREGEGEEGGFVARVINHTGPRTLSDSLA